MRVILKNTTFNVYGLSDISGMLSKISDNYGGIGDDIAKVETFLRALGADGSNDIWTKIKALHMPCLAAATDGSKAVYDIISDTIPTGPANYTIEEKRGIGPTTMGGTTGNIVASISNALISGFTVATKSARQSLSSSAAAVSTLGYYRFMWDKTAAKVTVNSNPFASVSSQSEFTVPKSMALSCKENGYRTLATSDGVTNPTSDSDTADLTRYVIAGDSCWCDIAIMGVCEGLTAEEAPIVAAALDAFAASFGVLST